MLLDLTQLRRRVDRDWIACASGVIDSARDFAAAAIDSSGPFVGLVVLGDDASSSRALRIDGPLVARVQITATAAHIDLQLPSPVPGYCGADVLRFGLRHATTGSWIVEVRDLGWFKDTQDVMGGLHDWVFQSGNQDIKLQVSSATSGRRGGFPLDQLGISTSAGLWVHQERSFEHVGWLGLMRADGESAQRSLALFVPAGIFHGTTTEAASGLKLAGLAKQKLGRDNGYSMMPVSLAFPLHSPGREAAWRAVVNWQPIAPQGHPTEINRLRLKDFAQAIWNDPVRASLQGAHVMAAGTPLVPAPILSLAFDEGNDDGPAAYPLLVFDLPKPATPAAAASAQARLRRIEFASSVPTTVTATLNWQSDGVGLAKGSLKGPGHLARSVVVLKGTIQPSQAQGSFSFPITEHALSTANRVSDACEPLNDDASSDLLLDLDLKGELVAGGDWIRWGSMEILPGNKAQLRCRLRGIWSAESCDLYPESDLILEGCRVRASVAADSAGRDLRAMFDAQDLAEDTLQRETDPLRHPRSVDPGRECKVRIRHLSQAGRMAASRVEVLATSGSATLGTESLYLQIRPFLVAVTKPAQIESEAGELIAVWSSDDPEGQQWRVPDQTIECLLPPQAIGETMERGVRFWTKDNQGKPTPIVDPARPLPFRFSPPTRLTFRPSLRDRRYNTSPSNLAVAFAGAKVDSFVTELVYPVQTEFKVSEQSLPDVRIQETGAYLGTPSPNLSPLPTHRLDPDGSDKTWRGDVRRVLDAAMADEAVYYASRLDTVRLQGVVKSIGVLRKQHSAQRANFAARLAEFHVYDPARADGSLHLREGLTFRIRDTSQGAPPLANPLPQWWLDYNNPLEDGHGNVVAPFTPEENAVDLVEAQKLELHRNGGPKFLSAVDPDHPTWGTRTDDGAIPAGVVHTIEFPSELLAVLRNPVSESGAIDRLAWTALGATGGFQCSFDEGRTTFIAETRHGQLSRLLRIRIGRIAVLWNKARHIVVYERTTVPSEQFESEQELGTARSRGWPILRKTEEYVEPIEPVRFFDFSDAEEASVPGFVAASEFISPRIYINGAWGRDLGHGYEIPLWNDADTSGFYPKPALALQVRAAGSDRSRCAHERPEHLYFYSNTEVGTGSDPDRWASKPGVDCPVSLTRLPVVTNASKYKSNNSVLDEAVLPPPRLGGTERPRFDFRVASDGKANLQHGRGDAEMLASLQVISLARTAEGGTQIPLIEKEGLATEWNQILERCQQSSDLQRLHEVEARASALIAKGIQTLLGAPTKCQELKDNLLAEIDKLFADVGARLAASPPYTVVVPSVCTEALNRLERELMDYERVLAVPFANMRADIQRARGTVRKDLASFKAGVKHQIAGGRDQIDQTFELAGRRIGALQSQLTNAQAALQGTAETVAQVIATALSKLDECITELAAATPNAAKLRSQLGAVKVQVERLIGHPTFGAAAKRVAQFIQTADSCLAVDRAVIDNVVKELKSALLEVARKLRACLATAAAASAAVSTAVDQALKDLAKERKNAADFLKSRMDELALASEADIDAALGRTLQTLDSFAVPADATTQQAAAATLRVWREATQKSLVALQASAAEPVDSALKSIATEANTLTAAAAKLLDLASTAAANWLAKAKEDAHDAVGEINCAAVAATAAAAEAALREALRDAEKQIRDKVTGLASSLVDDETSQKLAKLEDLLQSKPSFAKVASSGLKLVKALGEVPELPHLNFNTALAEYSFDDVKKQIETSPFAAKLREIDSGLKELGLAVPARALLDRIVPDSLENLDFNKVFKNFGGLDFQDFFKRFKLPNLGSDAVRLEHGVDKASRSAWVKAGVDADFREENTLFEFSSLAVRIANMELRARSDATIALGGERQSTTDAKLKGDWGLDIGGARLATFRDVTVRYDGSRFDFDISPDKVDLHPSVKFVSELAKQFKDLTPDLPAGVQLLKDERGVPIGAKAEFSQQLTLPSFGAVEIGPLLIASGLTLQVQPTGKFIVSTHVSLGSQAAPVWIQIGYLGGGLWLEAKATYKDSITYSASLGLAIGSARSINVAGIARGSYSLLLFAYAEISSEGGSLRAGFSMAGSARILGIANASVYLLLEVVHQSGHADGHGVLDVSIDICWCYSIHVRTEVQQKIGG